MFPDLFPETLLVDIADGHTFTTSLKIAEHFHKRHDNVLRNIENLECSPEFRHLNFEVASYLDDQKKPRLMYHITRDGFAFLAMGFTGSQAAYWKESFLAAFNAMEYQLRAQTEREAQALYRIRPNWRAIRVGTEGGLTRKQICTLTGHRSPDTITANKRRMRAAGLFSA